MRWVGWWMVAFAVACGGGQRAGTVPVDAVPLVSHSRQDFGLVALHKRTRSEFTVRNVGRAPLSITGLRLEGAASSELELAVSGPGPIPAGGAAVVGVTLAAREAGEKQAVVVVSTDAADARELRVQVSATAVDAHAELSVSKLSFGRIELGSVRELPIGLVNRSPLPVAVGFRAGGSFSARGPRALAPGESAALAVRFGPAGPGAHQADLRLSPCEGCAERTVRLYGEGLERALELLPAQVEFGALNVDRRAQRSLTVVNRGDLPVALFDAVLVPTSDPGFHLAPGPLGEIAPRGELSLGLEFSPTHLGAALGAVTLRTGSPRHPELGVPLRGLGGGPEIGLHPAVLDFGEHTVGSKSALTLRIQNDGGSALDLVVEAIELSGDSAFFVEKPPLPLSLPPGAASDLRVLYAPARPGRVAASLAIRSNDGSRPQATVDLSGGAQPALPCKLSAAPRVIDFGTLPPRQGAVLGFRVENTGTDVCALKDFALAGDAAGLFRFDVSRLPGVELRPGQWMVRHVSFAGSPAPGSYAAAVVFEVADPEHPRASIPVRAEVAASCLAAAPPFVDWGLVRGDCALPPAVVEVRNRCSAPVSVADLSIGEGTAPDEFELVEPPALPWTLASGESLPLSVRFRARGLGEAIAPFFVTPSDTGRPIAVPLLGENWLTSEAKDAFVVPERAQLDVLFVVDNSESMLEEQPRVQAAIPAFASALAAAGLDARVAATTTGLSSVSGAACPGGVGGGEAGRFFPVDRSAPRILSSSEPGFVDALEGNLGVGTCHVLEQPFEAVRRALSSPLDGSADDARTPELWDGNAGFRREGATLAVVIVSDEDDHSGGDVASYARFLRERVGVLQPEQLRVLAIAPTARACPTAGGFPGARYAELAGLLGGTVVDVCALDYAPALRGLIPPPGGGTQRTFPLSGRPDADGAFVSVDGVPETRWSYEAPANAVVFAPDVAPAPGSRVEIRYRRACGE